METHTTSSLTWDNNAKGSLDIRGISPDIMILLSKRFIERNIFKFYKVQPLIMLSHTIRTWSVTISPSNRLQQLIWVVYYERLEVLRWPIQYTDLWLPQYSRDCHRVRTFIRVSYFQNIREGCFGTSRNLVLFVIMRLRYAVANRLLTDTSCSGKSGVTPKRPSDVLTTSHSSECKSRISNILGALGLTLQAQVETQPRQGKPSAPWYLGRG